MLTGLMYYRPEDPLDFLESCLQRARLLGGPDKVQWDTFIGQEPRTLPPIHGGLGRRPVFWTDTIPAPCRRYERLPPIQAQFSIESDSDMTECTGLIQEFDVFDPSRARPKIIFIIGGPGSGKGTQSAKLASHFGFTCISVGEILRKQLIHRATSDRKWELIAKIIANGELAPPETTIEELKQQFIRHHDAPGFIVDGFPREIGQAFTFEEQIGSPDMVVFLACSTQRLRHRLLRRAAHDGRPDDNSHAIHRRLDTFKQHVLLIVKYYQEKGIVARFDADREEDIVFDEIRASVQEQLFPGMEVTGERSATGVTGECSGMSITGERSGMSITDSETSTETDTVNQAPLATFNSLRKNSTTLERQADHKDSFKPAPNKHFKNIHLTTCAKEEAKSFQNYGDSFAECVCGEDHPHKTTAQKKDLDSSRKMQGSREGARGVNNQNPLFEQFIATSSLYY
ncbi:adenylate kinase isoenzyme 5-like [Lissotriton helveticus]